MMRVHKSISAAMDKSLAAFRNQTGADKKPSRVSARARTDYRWVGTLCFVLTISLLVTAGFGFPRGIRDLARDWQASAADTIRGNYTAANLAQALLQRHNRYQNWATAFASRTFRRSTNNSAHPGSTLPQPVVLAAPSNLMVNSTSSTVIQLSWTAPGGTVNHYLVERSQSVSGSFNVIAQAPSTNYADNVTDGTAYLYRVRAVDNFGTSSPPSTMTLGTAISFADPELHANVNLIRAQHIYDLRQAIGAVRALAGLGVASWTDGTLTGDVSIQALHVNQLRDRLGEALAALSVPVGTYEDPNLDTGGSGTSIKKIHIEQLRLRATRGSSTSTGPGPTISDSSTARLDPANRTGGSGEDPLSRNFNWNVPLVGLSGRAGLSLGLSLTYNSLVWTRSGSSISFDDDRGFPSPGFRLGFPVIQPIYYNPEVGKNAFILIMPDGSRTELRQVGSSQLYEAADSSYLLLDTATMTLRSTDGTQLSYVQHGSDFQCTQIKDRNGNFITINYTNFGRIDTVVDTLARTVKFNYDGTNTLTSITQTWTVNGSPQAHTWATFNYNDLVMGTNFAGVTNVGPVNGAIVKVLTRVTLEDSSRFDFEYTTWGQIWKVSNYAADGHLLTYRSYNLPLNNGAAQTDCPRFTERRDWAENANRSGPNGATGLPGGPEQEVLTAIWAVPTAASWTMPDGSNQSGTLAQVTAANGTYDKIYFEGVAGSPTGWKRGLPALVETYDNANTRQRQSVTVWGQDNEALPYPLDPRVKERNIYDPAGNRARTTVTYQAITIGDGTSCNLPQDITAFQANATTPLRRTHTEYNLATTYTSRRIIGLVSEETLFQVDPNTWAETLMSKVGFQYDESGSIQGAAAPVQHDNTNYGAGFVAGRGNLSSVKRYDVFNPSQFVVASMKYNTAGATVAKIDPRNHQITVSYADSFSDGNNSRNTLAYPTTITDADGFSSTSVFNYDFGAVTRMQNPPPAGQSTGEIKHFTYDAVARIQKAAIEFNGNTNYSYTRFEYPTSQNRVDTYSTIVAGLGEAHSFEITDGHGRVIATASDHPGSAGGFSAKLTLFDAMGRATKSSNPTETSASGTPSQWTATGDDAAAGWFYTHQTYDWKGRPLVTTNPDDTTKQASYAGCGCAGGEVVTLTDEGTIYNTESKRRQQKVYSDILGRTIKIEMLNWDGAGAEGTGGTVYSTTVNTFNARDQITLSRVHQGPDTNSTYQDTITTYDGHGRLGSHKRAEQTSPTTYTYYPDDGVHVITDARVATTTFAYNARQLVSSIEYGGGYSAPGVTLDYDAAGNRTSMSDGMGTVSYNHDQLSRVNSETRYVNDLNQSFTLTYGYNLASQLTTIAEPSQFGSTVINAYDSAGQLSDVTGTGGGASQYASNFQYRASGGLKHLNYGNSLTLDLSYNNRLQATQYDVKTAGGSRVMGVQYQYDNAGRIKESTDLVNSNLNRSYMYDNVGRLIMGNTANGALTGPYSQTYLYDVWGNLTWRSWRTFAYSPFCNCNFPQTQGSSYAYSNNRSTASGWNYDADGRLLLSVESGVNFSYGYDAAGRQTSASLPGKTISESYDGDGRRSKWIENGVTTHYIRSSPLGGQIVTELDQYGAKKRGYVYAGGQSIAKHENGQVLWDHRDASGVSMRATNSSGTVTTKVETDPLGTQVDDTSAYNQNGGGNGYGFNPMGFYGDPTMPNMGCRMDGVPADCNMVQRLMNSGAAVQCPQSGCGPRAGVNAFTGRTELFQFSANAAAAGIGTFGVGLGFLPTGVNFVGNGFTVATGRGAIFSGMGTMSDTPMSVTFQYYSLNQIEILVPWRSPPQDSGFDTPGITDLVNRTLSNPDCAKFYQQILASVSAKNPPLDGGNMKDIFNRFLAQKKGGFTREKPEGNAGYGGIFGHIPKGDGKIFSAVIGDPARQTWYDAQTALAELMHLGASKGWFSDYDLAVAANNIPEYAKLFPLGPHRNVFDARFQQEKNFKVIGIGPPKDKASLGYSTYIHNIERVICPVPKTP